MAKNVLIATLGESPIVVTSMVHALQTQKDLPIDELHVIHPKEEIIDEGYKLVKEHLDGKCCVTRSILQFPDVSSYATSITFLRVLSEAIQMHEELGNHVYLSLAGGRKNMSALMAATCQFYKCVRGLYHILDKYENDSDKQNFYSIEALWLKFEKSERSEKLNPPSDELILVEIPYQQSPSGVALRQYLSAPNASLSDKIDEINDDLYVYGRRIFQKEKSDEQEQSNILDVYLSKEAYDFYQHNHGQAKRLMGYFRSMRNSQVLTIRKHHFQTDNAKTDCTCFKKRRTDERLFYYQTGNKIVIATIVKHGPDYDNIINGRRTLCSQDHPQSIHFSDLKEKSVLIAPLGKTPMVVTQTFTLLSTLEGADIEKVIVIHPKDYEIRKGVKRLKNVFGKKGKDRPIESIEVKGITDVASVSDCNVYLKELTKVITKERADNPDKSIHLSLSGGRKGMAALTIFAAQQAKIDAVYHTVITDVELEKQIERETTSTALEKLSLKERVDRLFLEAYDPSKFELFRVPIIPI